MQTNYGKLAFQKTEDIIRNLAYKKDNLTTYSAVFRDKPIDFENEMFKHSISAKAGSIVSLNINLNFSDNVNITTEVYLNNVLQKSSNSYSIDIHFVSSGIDNVSLKFVSSANVLTSVSSVNFDYVGYLNNNHAFDVAYIDSNLTGYYVTYLNGAYTRYLNLDSFLSSYKYQTGLNEFYSVNSTINGNNKLAFHGLYHNETYGGLALKNLSTNASYNLVKLKVDDAAFINVSSSKLRILYLYQGKVYFVLCSRTGTGVTEPEEIQLLSNLQVTKIFPLRVVDGNATSFYGFGVVTKDKDAYVVRFSSVTSSFDSKKYIGKCERASGYFDSSSISVVLYSDGVATIKKYGDRMLTNLIESKIYYNYLSIYNFYGTLVGLNYNGLSTIP